MCRLSWNLGASTSWKPQGLSRPVMGLLYLFFLLLRPKVPSSEWIFNGGKPDDTNPSSADFKNAWIYVSDYPYVFAAWHLIRNTDDFVFLIWYVVMRKVMKRTSQNTNFGTEKQTNHKRGLIVFLNETRYKAQITLYCYFWKRQNFCSDSLHITLNKMAGPVCVSSDIR
jgi:hypothetical protein